LKKDKNNQGRVQALRQMDIAADAVINFLFFFLKDE
jgi:hypothetical protein